MWHAVVFSVLLVHVATQENCTKAGVGVSQCQKLSGSLPLAVSMLGCRSSPCRVVQGEYAIVDVAFTAPRNIENMTATASVSVEIGFILTMEMEHQIDLGEYATTCKHLLNAECPVRKEDLLFYRIKIYVERVVIPIIIIPVTGLTAPVELSVVDEYKNPVFCFRAIVLMEGIKETVTNTTYSYNTIELDISQTTEENTRPQIPIIDETK